MAELKPKKQQKKIKQMIDTVMIGTAEALARAQRNGEIKDQTTEFMFIVYTAITLWQEVAKEQVISAWNKRSGK